MTRGEASASIRNHQNRIMSYESEIGQEQRKIEELEQLKQTVNSAEHRTEDHWYHQTMKLRNISLVDRLVKMIEGYYPDMSILLGGNSYEDVIRRFDYARRDIDRKIDSLREEIAYLNMQIGNEQGQISRLRNMVFEEERIWQKS